MKRACGCALSRLKAEPCDVLLLDLSLPDSQGLDTVARACEHAPQVPIIVLTGTADEAVGFEAIRRGAQDYLVKGQTDGHLLLRAIRYATQRKQVEQALRDSQQELQAANQSLEQRVAERTAEAEERAAQLQRLAVELTQAEQRERQQLAQILHDHLQQLLVGAKFNIGILRNQLNEAGQREALKQVDDLLSESLRTSRSLTAELSPPVLHEGSLAQVLEWLARWMQDKHGLRVEVEADEQVDPPTQEVRILLFQAVRELLLNIIKHAKVDRARIVMHQLGADQIRILVADEGAGFDPSQSRTDPHESQSGSGFGLFSIRERLELLGGWMRIDSQAGQGTRIALTAPCYLPDATTHMAAGASAEQAAAGRAARQAVDTKPHDEGVIHVLLADDHAVVRDGLTRLLQLQPGMVVVGQAADGQEAVKLALQLQPEVIVMDVSMPHLGGVEATRCITEELPNVQVIGLSMHVQEDVAAQMKAAGAAAYLTKTTPPETLVAKIRELAPRPAGRSAGKPAARTSHNRKVIRVLLADDHEVLRNGLAHLLEIQPDIQVVGLAVDGLQVVQMALQLKPDIIVMDVSMPHLSGVDVTAPADPGDARHSDDRPVRTCAAGYGFVDDARWCCRISDEGLAPRGPRRRHPQACRQTGNMSIFLLRDLPPDLKRTERCWCNPKHCTLLRTGAGEDRTRYLLHAMPPCRPRMYGL